QWRQGHQLPSLPPAIDGLPLRVAIVETLPEESAANLPGSDGAPGSPISDVPDDAWREFVARLAREAPTFSSSRHVGQYRQRRERLAELDLDPSMLHGSAAKQRAALDADLTDAYRHAAAGGMTDHIGRSIVVPGCESPVVISLAGLLGVIQCAGL